MPRIKAIIFDMDGVLIDAKDWHYEALNSALSLFGMEISRYDHLVTFDGLPTSKKLEMLSEERGFPRALHSFINELKQQYTMDLVHTKCKPRFVHEYALSQLKRDGYKLAVASNSIRNTVRSMMEYSSLLPYLEFFLSNQDVAVAKPDPEIYLKAIANLNVSPDECLVLEDNENGRKAAKSSGAWLMEIGAIEEVNYLNIKTFIERINQGAVGQ